MQTELDQLVHDAASLQRFVQFLTRFCEEQENRHAYVASSVVFFKYVQDLGTHTVNFLQPYVSHTMMSSDLIQIHRRKLVAIKKFWSLLHGFIKPATDAHALSIPLPLLDVIEDQLRSLAGLSGASIVTVLSVDLNYFQYRLARLKESATLLTSVIPGAPGFPHGLGFIAIPYSQAASLFTNTLIYHELGHFVFEELSKDGQVSKKIDEALSDTFGSQFDTAPEPSRSWCRDHLLSWSEEIYCDLFALSVVGPAYSFASIDLFSLLVLLEQPRSLEFKRYHPAEACRFNEQLQYLTEHGWWDGVQHVETPHISLIESLAAKPEEDYTYPMAENAAVGQRLLKAFLLVRPQIKLLLEDTAPLAERGLADFREWQEDIKKYLRHGVVPSSVSRSGQTFYPSPVAIINTSICFYLGSLVELLGRIRGYDPNNVGNRSEVGAKVEMWAMKALEDNRLLTLER